MRWNVSSAALSNGVALFNIKQYVSQDFCLRCLGCCRYNCNSSIWAPGLLAQEEKELNLKKIELIAYRHSYICCFLDLETNLCLIYAQRPLECWLYPFLLNRCGRKLFLGLDLNCPFAKGKTNSLEFKRYSDYLINYLKSPSVFTALSDNLQVFSSYPLGEIFNLAELEINCHGI